MCISFKALEVTEELSGWDCQILVLHLLEGGKKASLVLVVRSSMTYKGLFAGPGQERILLPDD